MRCRTCRPIALALFWLLGALPALAAADPAGPLDAEAARAGESVADEAEAGESVADDSTHLDTPPFPGRRHRDALRLNLDSRFLPGADLGPGHTTLYRPELRGRVTLPVSDRAVLRVSGRVRISRYEFSGDPFRFGGVSLTGDSLNLYETRLAVQGAYRLNAEHRSLLHEGEVWSLLGSAFAASEFESGSFDDGLSGGGALALGYQLDGTLRVAAGLSLGTSIDGGGLDLGPTGSFRWNITEDLTLRDHGFGVQLEYRLTPNIELFASGYRTTDEYRLRDVSGAPDELTFRDRQVLVGAGFEWKLSRRLRLNLEAGAVSWRKVRVHSDDLGTLVSQRGDPSPYLELRVEVRP
jgi:hypothetical protein